MNFLNTGVHTLNFFASFSANQRRRDTLVQTSLSKFHCHVFGMTLIPFFQNIGCICARLSNTAFIFILSQLRLSERRGVKAVKK